MEGFGKHKDVCVFAYVGVCESVCNCRLIHFEAAFVNHGLLMFGDVNVNTKMSVFLA